MDYINSKEVRESEEAFKYRITKVFKDKGIKSVDIPNELGMTRVSFARYLSGDRTPDYQHLIALALYFRVSLDWLTGLDSRTTFSQEEKDILKLYNKASAEDREIINLILKKYE